MLLKKIIMFLLLMPFGALVGGGTYNNMGYYSTVVLR